MAKSSGGSSSGRGGKRTGNPPPATSRPIRTIAAEGLSKPKSLSAKNVQSLAASTMRHIEPRK